MESKAKAFGHPIHPMLITLPVGLFVMAIVSDILYLITRSSIFPVVSFVDIAAGVIGGLLAAIFGFRDWLAIPNGTRAKSIATTHGIGNVIVVVLFAISWLIRNGSDTVFPSAVAMIFSFVGIIVACGTAWLGGELVDRLGVGVDPGANLNAPSSLSGQPAMETVADRAPVVGVMSYDQVPVTGDEQRREEMQTGTVENPTDEHDVDEP